MLAIGRLVHVQLAVTYKRRGQWHLVQIGQIAHLFPHLHSQSFKPDLTIYVFSGDV